MVGKRRILGVALAAGLVGAPGAAAQEPVEIRVVAAGMTVAGIEVFVLVDGEPWRVGETDADGRVTAPGDLVGLRPGDGIEVHQVICSDDRAVLFVPPDESPESECERRRRDDPSCRCSSLGTVGWGGDVAVDVVAEPSADPDYERRGGRPRWVAGAGAGWISFPNLDKGCAASPLALACELEAEGPTFRVAAEARPRPDFPLSIMGAVGYSPELVVDHLFAASDNPRDPRRNVSELEVVTFEGYAVGRFAALSAADLFLALGYVWAYDRVEATTTFGDGGTATEERADSGGRLGGRAGLDWWSAGRGWGIRLEVGGMTGEEEDIDTSWSAVGMVLVPVSR